METSELLKKVKQIEIKTKDLTKRLFSGEYHSAFKGRGMSFSEVRNYQYGDDVRNIDWNVTARTGEPHVKIFEEERELTVFLLIDLSGSTAFGTGNHLKREIVTEIAAVLAFSAITNNDKVGVLFFTDTIEGFIPPKKGKTHILRIIRELVNREPKQKKTDINLALEYFNNIIKKQCIAFLISDFFDHDYKKPLLISARKHDLVGIQVFDSAETLFPPSGFLIRVKDTETGATFLTDAASKSATMAYAAEFNQFSNDARDIFNKTGGEFIALDSTASYINVLHQFFLKRMKRKLFA